MRQFVITVLILACVLGFSQAGVIGNVSFEFSAPSPNSASLGTSTGWQQFSGFTSLINGAFAADYPMSQDGQQ